MFAADVGRSHRLLRDKQGHLATQRSGWNLNYKGVKFKTKSVFPLKPAWPFPLQPFRFPWTSLLGDRGLVYGSARSMAQCWRLEPPDYSHGPTGNHLSVFPDKDPNILPQTQGAKQSRGAICPSVQPVIKSSIAHHSSSLAVLSPVVFMPLICHSQTGWEH